MDVLLLRQENIHFFSGYSCCGHYILWDRMCFFGIQTRDIVV